jgi:hypothetical protein
MTEYKTQYGNFNGKKALVEYITENKIPVGTKVLSSSTLMKKYDSDMLVMALDNHYLKNNQPTTNPAVAHVKSTIKTLYSKEQAFYKLNSIAKQNNCIAFMPERADGGKANMILLAKTNNNNGLPYIEGVKLDVNVGQGNVVLKHMGRYSGKNHYKNLKELNSAISFKGYGLEQTTIDTIMSEAKKHIPNLPNTPVEANKQATFNGLL